MFPENVLEKTSKIGKEIHQKIVRVLQIMVNIILYSSNKEAVLIKSACIDAHQLTKTYLNI